MRIVCPNCSATYDVPPALLQPAGRKVKCARCGRSWTPRPDVEEPLRARIITPLPEIDVTPIGPTPLAVRASRDAGPGPPAPPPPVAVSARLVPARAAESPPPAAPAGARPRTGGAAVGWIMTALILAAAGYGAYTYRPQIEAAWPPSQRAYALLGLQ